MEILEQAVDYGFVDFTTVFGDSTHQKANANKRKSVKKEVEILKKKYEDDLLVEINEDRECIGKEAFDSMVHTEYVHDEETGEEVKKTSTKTITESTIDPESGCFHKGEKEKCFAYSHQTFCDKNSFDNFCHVLTLCTFVSKRTILAVFWIRFILSVSISCSSCIH